MADETDSHLDALYEEYQRQRANLADLHRRMSEVSGTAVSPRREVSVTVTNQGAITELKFPTNAYKKLAPTELAELLTSTIAKAQEQVRGQSADIIAPLLPEGIDAGAIMAGSADIGKMLPEDPQPHSLVRDQLSRWR